MILYKIIKLLINFVCVNNFKIIYKKKPTKWVCTNKVLKVGQLLKRNGSC
jgi:hypothetical protein